MGYILTATAVDLGEVTIAIGSKNKRLLSSLFKEFGDDFEQFDEMAADFADEGKPQTMKGVLRQLVMGEEYDEGIGFMYGYALEFICLHFGEGLPNGEWSAMPSGSKWAETVDRGLKAAGVPERVLRVGMHLMNRGSPIPIPEIDDFPGIGYLRLAEVRTAQEALARADLAAVKDKEVVAAIEQLRDWFQACAESGRDLVCYYA